MPPLAAADRCRAARQSAGGGVRERAIGPCAGRRRAGAAGARPAARAAAARPAAARRWPRCCCWWRPAQAQLPSPPWRAALDTRLAYVVTGDAAVDGTSRAGLAGLSGYVNRRTAATSATRRACSRARTTSASTRCSTGRSPPAQALSGHAVAALNDFMRDGGIIVIDSRGGTGERSRGRRAPTGPGHPAADAADHRARAGARLLPAAASIPGRTGGDTVWVQRPGPQQRRASARW